jgi:large subunit ribosomal protein L19
MNTTPIIDAIERKHARSDLPQFRAGDTIRVHALISEGGKERVQVFEGVCIHRKRGGARGSFTVRKVSTAGGVGVERVWPESSPRVVKVELVNRGRVRRAKLYYLRNLRGNAARIKSKLGDYAEVIAGQEKAQEQARAEQAVEAAAEAERAAAEEADKRAEEQAKKAEAAKKAGPAEGGGKPAERAEEA